MFSTQDLEQIKQRGLTPEQVNAQLERFAKGFPYLRLHSAATAGNGVVLLNDREEVDCMRRWQEFRQSGATIEKFVPASGAASRMFKNLFAFVSSGRNTPETDFERTFFDNLRHFAFYPLLNKACVDRCGKNVTELINAGRYVDVVKMLLNADGLNYGSLPKGLLKFHRATPPKVHTPLEEHIEEGAQYAADATGHVSLHLTVSPEHRAEFERLLADRLANMEKVWGVTIDVTMSEQKPSTDTIAVTADNAPYRNADGQLLFRPAGHGALLANLNERNADVLFIKNIDNVVPLRHRAATTRYKKVLAGYLVGLQRQIAAFLQQLEHPEDLSDKQLAAMLHFAEDVLSIHRTDTAAMDAPTLAAYLTAKFNRPIRVCGMVRNEGEPGGGPYLAYNADGSYSPQVLEAAQIDPADAKAVAMMHEGTHFNPVDLVCYTKDYKGRKFDLMQFTDPETGLISEKSKDGVDIKALELPGLWNGAMSDWVTVFVQVPIETFNPVKTVNDLLRPQHQ